MTRKGVGTTISSILIIIFIFTIIMVYYYIISTSTEAAQKLNLREAEIMRARDTALLSAKSLEISRFMAILQAVFKTGFEAAGCEDGYWYRTELAPKTYTQYGNPKLCSKSTDDLRTYILEKLETNLDILGVNGDFDANSIKTKINTKPNAYISINDDSIVSRVEDSMENENVNPKISMATPSESTVQTELSKMVDEANKISTELLGMSFNMDRYRSLVYDNHYNTQYLSMMENEIISKIKSHEKNLKNTKINMVKNSFELKMPDAKDEIVYNSQTNNNARLNSLMLHYDLTVQMQESPGGISFNCQKAPEKYDSIINTAVSQDWEFVQFGIEPKIYRYSQDDMKLLISAMINKESGWNPKAVSPKGAIGLMQIMPSTAESDCKISGDVLTDETENIKCGTLYLRKMMDQFLSKAKTEDDLMMFALAAYNWGPGNLENAIKETGADNWQDLSAKASIPKETYNYVLAVTGCMNAYKIRQSIETKTTQLAWPTASRRITSCYGEPRINKNGKPYQHGGIDIGRIENDPNVVKAAADGIVESIVENCREGDAACGGRYGNYILINHGSYKTRYAHLKENGVYVSEDKTVKTGDVIGLTGNTGDSSAMHLHFEVLSMMSKTINPCAFIGCSESTEKKCGTATVDTIDATGMRGFYYYYDDGYDSFEPRPITLEFKVEDYLMPIYCDTQRIYYWTKPRELETARPDLMCFMDDSRGPRKYELYFCQRTVDNKLTEPPAGMDSSHVLQVGGFLKQTGGQIAAAPQSQLTYRCGDQGFVQQ